MSADDTQKRLQRLKAMQAKHADRAAAVTAPPAARTPAEATGAGQGIGPAAGGGAPKAKSALIQKLRQQLSGPDGKIDVQKAKMFVAALRKQAADPAAPRHDMAKRLLEKVKSLPPEQRKRLMALAGSAGAGAGPRAGLGAGLGAASGPGGRSGAKPSGFGGGANSGLGKGLGAGFGGDSSTESPDAWFDTLLDKL